ncbi:hypothetical protein GCM10008955_24590 [Deinococcus malanensis]|uniref:Uncharacterized protein n=2 Tax=Deinococcus malanensis TaxID=1706855 RepID=A0ABQ2EXK5_9DEIO|nr:hypothetical protein GCM10008955_24590 [Deinococcus malanensis]
MERVASVPEMTAQSHLNAAHLREDLQAQVPQDVLVYVEGRPEGLSGAFLITIKQAASVDGQVYAVEMPFQTLSWAAESRDDLAHAMIQFVFRELDAGLPPAVNNGYVRRPMR